MGSAKIVIAYENRNFSKQIEYVFNLFFSVLGIKAEIMSFEDINETEEKLIISYGKTIPNGSKIHIFASDFFGENYLKKESMPSTPLKRFNNLPIIFFGRGDLPNFVDKSGSIIKTNMDIIASSFFMVTRYEEAVLQEKDRFGRFPAKASLAFKEDFLSRAIVNEYIEIFWQWIESSNTGIKRGELWPDNKKFAFLITHDIDLLYKYGFYKSFKEAAAVLLREGDIAKAFTIFRDYLKNRVSGKNDPYFNLKELAGMDRSNRFSSAFYFMTKGADYDLADRKVLGIIREIKKSGLEVGLHLGFNTFDDNGRMEAEKKRFESLAGNSSYGVRQHALRFKAPETWRLQNKAEFAYDSSLGFADYEGFRCGICFPFHPFDLFEEKTLDIYELPLIIMDCTLFRSDYRNLNASQGFEIIKKYIDLTERYRGLMVILWHNYSLDESGHPGWTEVFKKTLEYAKSLNPCSICASDIVKWWDKRQI